MLEAWVVLRKGHPDCLSGEDELVRFRGTGNGKRTTCKIVRKGVCKEGRDSEWMKYWNRWGMGYWKNRGMR
jgi:hypothetical protein